MIALIAGSFVLGGFIRLGAWYEDLKLSEVPRVKFPPGHIHSKGADDDPGKPGNFLIVGNDSRGFVHNAKDKEHFGEPSSLGGTRSDTIMIAHIDPAVKIGRAHV